MDDLSKRQQSILEFIQSFSEENGYPPSIREIGKSCGISSTSVVNYNLNILERKEYIERQREISRGIRLGPRAEDAAEDEPLNGELVHLPLAGVIVAGYPVPVPDSDFDVFDEMVTVTKDMVRAPETSYALRVQGESMIDALVNDGDVVIVQHQQHANNGDMVAAWLKEEKETTLKYFFWEDGKQMVRLQPANPSFDPIMVHPSNVEIQGKVVAVLRQID
jgi:repressor LexA